MILRRNQESGHQLSTDAAKGWGSSATGYLSDLRAGGKRSEVGLQMSMWGKQQSTQKKVSVISQLQCGLGYVMLKILSSIDLIYV